MKKLFLSILITICPMMAFSQPGTNAVEPDY